MEYQKGKGYSGEDITEVIFKLFLVQYNQGKNHYYGNS